MTLGNLGRLQSPTEISVMMKNKLTNQSRTYSFNREKWKGQTAPWTQTDMQLRYYERNMEVKIYNITIYTI